MTDPQVGHPDPTTIGDALRRSFDQRDPDALQPELVRLMLELSHERPAAAPAIGAVAPCRTPWWRRALLAVRR